MLGSLPTVDVVVEERDESFVVEVGSAFLEPPHPARSAITNVVATRHLDTYRISQT